MQGEPDANAFRLMVLSMQGEPDANAFRLMVLRLGT